MTMARKGGGYHESIEGLKVIRGTGYNKGEFITTRSLSGPRKGYPEECTKNVMVNTTPGRLRAVRGH